MPNTKARPSVSARLRRGYRRWPCRSAPWSKPAAIASSRSADMPSTVYPAKVTLLVQLLQAIAQRDNCASSPSGRRWVRGCTSGPRSRRFGKLRDCAASAGTSAKHNRFGFTLTLTWMHNLQRRQRCSDAVPTAVRRFSAGRWVHPVKMFGHRTGLVALQRADEMPFRGRDRPVADLVDALSWT